MCSQIPVTSLQYTYILTYFDFSLILRYLYTQIFDIGGALGPKNRLKVSLSKGRCRLLGRWGPQASISLTFCYPKTVLKIYEFSTSPKNVPKQPTNRLSDAQGSNLESKNYTFQGHICIVFRIVEKTLYIKKTLYLQCFLSIQPYQIINLLARKSMVFHVFSDHCPIVYF